MCKIYLLYMYMCVIIFAHFIIVLSYPLKRLDNFFAAKCSVDVDDFSSDRYS